MNNPIMSLDARYYTDPKFFQIECHGLLAKTWQFACHSSEIAMPGAYTVFEIAGESLFAVRDHEHNVRVFYNVCQHRGHQLVAGQGRAPTIVCPYHAWSYNLDGRLRSGPNIDVVEGFEVSSVCLTEIKSEDFLGFIFVNLDAETAPMDDWFPNSRIELAEWVPNWQKLKPLEWLEVPEKCNWKVSVENYSECYHCALNHPTFSKGVVKPETYDIQPQGKCLRHTTKCQNLENMTYDIQSGFAHYDEYSSWFLWPMFSFQVYPGNILNTYHWRAVDVDHVVLWRGWYADEESDIETVHKLAMQDRDTTVAEDIDLVESVQRGLSSRGYQPGPLVIDPQGGVNSEHPVMHLQRWIRETVDGT